MNDQNNELPMTQPATETNPRLPCYSPGLSKLLHAEGADSQGAIRIIAINPVLRAEAEALLPQVRQALAPSNGSDILTVLVNREPQFGIPQMTEGQAAERYGDYLDDLEGFSAAIVFEAFRAWRRCEMYPDQPGRHAFYPRGAEIRTLAQRVQSKLGQAQYRCKLALEYVDKAPPKRIDPEERKRVGQMMRELADSMGSPGSKTDMESRRIIR